MIKNKFPVLFFFLLCSKAYSQQLTLALPRFNNNVAYVGLECPLSCTVENTDSRSVVLTTDKGTITRENNIFLFVPLKEPGVATITINIKKSGRLKKVGETIIEVRPIPRPTAYVGGVRGDSMLLGAFKEQGGIGCTIPGLGFELNQSITEFTLTIMRDNSNYISEHVTGSAFTGKVRKLLDLLEINDHVVISGMSARGADSTISHPDPLEFVMK